MAEPVELSWIDSDVYQSGDEKVPNQAWLNFGQTPDGKEDPPKLAGGYWGEPKSPPITPRYQSSWQDDGSNGFYFELNTLASIGDDWDKDRKTTSIAFGRLDGKEVVGVALNEGVGDRFEISYFDPGKTGLQSLCKYGSGWPKSVGITGIAFGHLGKEGIVGVTLDADKQDRFEIYRYDNGLKLIAHGGNSWSNNQTATAIDFGTLSKGSTRSLVGIARKSPSGAKFYIYEVTESTNELTPMLSGGEHWSGNTYAKAIAFGWLNHQQVVGVTLSSDEGNRYEIYLIVPGRTTLHFLCAGGTGWGPGRFATAIAFGVLGGRPVVGVTRNHGDNQRFEISYMNQKTDGTCELVALVDGCGSVWGDGRGGTGIAFGQINGKGLVGVTRNAGDNAELFLFQYEVDEKGVGVLVGYSTQSVDWSADQDATCIAIGFLGGMNVVGYGRSKGKGSRGGILGWSA